MYRGWSLCVHGEVVTLAEMVWWNLRNFPRPLHRGTASCLAASHTAFSPQPPAFMFLCNILAFAQQHAAVHKVSVQNWKCCYVWRCWLTAIWHIVFVLALTPCCCSHSKVLLFLQVKTFGPLASNSEDKLSMFMELVDGVFLHKIMTHMWVAPTAVHTNVCVCMCSLIMQLSCGLYFCNHILSLSAWYQTGYRHHFCLYASSRSINI